MNSYPSVTGPWLVYTFLDDTGAPLYVGCSSGLGRRISQHQYDKPWFSEVVTITIVRYDVEAEAHAAELETIRRTRPAHNVVGRMDLPIERGGWSTRRANLARKREQATR